VVGLLPACMFLFKLAREKEHLYLFVEFVTTMSTPQVSLPFVFLSSSPEFNRFFLNAIKVKIKEHICCIVLQNTENITAKHITLSYGLTNPYNMKQQDALFSINFR
jgi:hypothetical protein